MVAEWKKTGERSLAATRVFELWERTYVSPRTGRELPFYVLDAADWVNVVPLLDDGRVVMVRQWRHGTRTVTLELPGGVVEPGETPEHGARRELREETGYEAERVEPIGRVDPNPAIQSNATHTFLATGLRRVGDPAPDSSEDIEVTEVALDAVPDLLRRGEITHSLVVAAFHWLELRRSAVARIERLVDDLSREQLDRVAALARRVNSRLGPDDLRSPHDFPELASDPDFNYQDGVLAGVDSVRAALRRLLREV